VSEPRRRLLILGASSGIGAGCARVFAAHGYDIFGVHLDRRPALPRVQALQAELEASGARVRLFNQNAADPDQRQAVIAALAEDLRPAGAGIDVLLHSLAFGSLGAFVPADSARPVQERQLAMTVEVMASSLAWWVRDLALAGLLGHAPVLPRPAAGTGGGARVFALTSAGTQRVWPGYGPVSAAKAALDALVRQLAVELMPRGITVNAIMPGITRTPALAVIPGHERMLAQAEAGNPGGRLTTPEDVGHALLALCALGTAWMTGNCIRVDGGEDLLA
jgi:NAD(P)-dependent dehydrogenase (short-subunit alcohol dehydrogenase family)